MIGPIAVPDYWGMGIGHLGMVGDRFISFAGIVGAGVLVFVIGVGVLIRASVPLAWLGMLVGGGVRPVWVSPASQQDGMVTRCSSVVYLGLRQFICLSCQSPGEEMACGNLEGRLP